MNFNTHSHLAGKHAFLSASKYHWIRYDEEKLDQTFMNAIAAAKGTELHDIAAKLIANNIKLPRSRQTLNMFVNDAIGFRLSPEQVLYYSDNAFGTADAIGFFPKKMKLMISDLKTGISVTSMDQLMIYAAFFCLEYKIKPSELIIELRIYQNDEVVEYVPELEEIVNIIDKVVTFDKRIEALKAEALS